MIAKIIGGHFGLTPKLGKFMAENMCQAYNYPWGWWRVFSGRPSSSAPAN
jgi:acyl CoA:acetate/3-ketoacid CoA transferase